MNTQTLVPVQISIVLLGILLAAYAEGQLDEPEIGFITLFLLKFCREIGYFLASAVTVHLIYLRCLQKQQTEFISEQMKNEILPNMVMHGLCGIKKFSLSFHVLENLKNGDTLYWLDTYCPNPDKLSKSLENAIIRGAKVMILSIKADCKNAVYRTEELSEESQRKGNVKPQIEIWQNCLRNISESLKQNKETKGSLEVLLYEDLLGMPLYIQIRNGQPIHGYSGFYVNNSASDFIYLEWKPSSSNGMIRDLANYFDGKWKRNLNNRIL